ncbi:MAG: hypothetical protein K0R46_2754 [Herbinix sp.]|nr:hypothetical protein [Herbinix sp.]
MAKCKSCKTNIPEGDEYCMDCKDKANAKANESYLDSLLNSVKDSPSTENIYKKKNNTNEKSGNPDNNMNQVQKTVNEYETQIRQEKEPIQSSEIEDDDLYGVDFSDIEDFDQFNLDEDLSDIDSNIIISDEDLYGESLSSLLEGDGYEEENIDLQTEVEKVVENAYTDEQQLVRYAEDEEATVTMEEAEEIDQLPVEENSVNEKSSRGEIDYIEETNSDFGEMRIEIDRPEDNQIQDEYSELQEDTDIDLDLDELLNSLDTQSLEAIVEENMANPDEDMFSTFGDENIEEMARTNGAAGNNKNNEFEQVEADQDDFLSLLSQMSDEDSSAEDIKAISEMLSNNSKTSKKSSMPSNVGEVFSDALKVVSTLDDYELDEAEILGNVPDHKNTRGSKAKASKEEKKKEQKDSKGQKDKKKAIKEKSGLSLFQRLFGNVKDDKTAAKHEAEQKKLIEPKAVKAKKVKGKVKNGSAPSDEEVEEFGDKKGAKDKVAKKESKKEKAEKKKKAKEIIQVIDEIEEDPGRINRTGAIIIFFFFGIIAIILILGTNLVTYTLSIQHATTYFDHRKYTQAYNEVYGVEIKDEDIEIYDKIMTVMFVNKQLNSYNNYFALGQYPEALDSLLKGLSRYEKYIELATILDIESDLDYVRTQILAELSNVFNLSEAEAMKILEFDNLDDYSVSVYDVVLEKMNN